MWFSDIDIRLQYPGLGDVQTTLAPRRADVIRRQMIEDKQLHDALGHRRIGTSLIESVIRHLRQGLFHRHLQARE